MPSVSVIIPAFNRAHTLARAMRSALRQDFDGLELIVVDDHSSDGTEAIARGIADQRVRYVRHERNAGAAAARNTGVRHARADFIAFLDSDDEWLPGKLVKQRAALETAGAETGLALCGLLRWDGTQPAYLPGTDRRAARAPWILEEILRTNYALTSGWFLRRRHFEEVGPFDESLPSLEDWEWLIRYCARYPAAFVDEPLCMIYQSQEGLNANVARYCRSLQMIIGRHGASLAGPHRAGLAGLHYTLGKKRALDGDAVAARRAFGSALALTPAHWRAAAAWLLSLAGPRAFQSAWRRMRLAKGYQTRIT